MKRASTLLFGALMALNSAAAPMVIVGGNSGANAAAQQAANAAGAQAAAKPGSCYWQVPGLQRWVNTNALSVTVGKTGTLTIFYGYRTEIEVEIGTVAGGNAAAASFFARIEECRK